MLNLNNVEVVYDGVILVLRGISIEVQEGRITTVLGANGAGKSTTLKAISGVLRSERGEITRGTIEFNGDRIDGMRAHELVEQGIVQVFEGRQVFEHLTAEENLIAGGHIVSTPVMQRNLEMVYEYFPRVHARRDVQAGYLSGGEQQMLVIGRALMSDPKMIMLDEPSSALAPQVVLEIFHSVDQIRRDGTTVLLVEQNVRMALLLAHFGYVIKDGVVHMQGEADALIKDDNVRLSYLGGTLAKAEGSTL